MGLSSWYTSPSTSSSLLKIWTLVYRETGPKEWDGKEDSGLRHFNQLMICQDHCMQPFSDHFLGFEEYSTCLLDGIFVWPLECPPPSCRLLHSTLRIASCRSVHHYGRKPRVSIWFARTEANYGHRRWPGHVIYIYNGNFTQTCSIWSFLHCPYYYVYACYH